MKGKSLFVSVLLIACLITVRGAAEDDFEEMMQNALKGDSNAECDVGLFYQSGVGVPVSYQKAFYWYAKSATKGNQRAQKLLVICVQNGWGTAKDETMAHRILLKLANEGLAEAQMSLGLEYHTMYLKDQGEFMRRNIGYSGPIPGVETNAIQAYLWFSLASASIPQAKRDRIEIEREMNTQSIQIAQKIAEDFKAIPAAPFDIVHEQELERQLIERNKSAKINLALEDQRRRKVEMSNRVVAWQEMQASNGVDYAQYDLALRYLKGDGVPTNRVRALELLQSAAAQKYGDAVRLLEKLSTK